MAAELAKAQQQMQDLEADLQVSVATRLGLPFPSFAIGAFSSLCCCWAPAKTQQQMGEVQAI